MSAGTTNLGDLELARAGIQAREIDSESAAAGAVLTADGAGGVAWQAAAGGSGKKYVALLAQSDEDRAGRDGVGEQRWAGRSSGRGRGMPVTGPR